MLTDIGTAVRHVLRLDADLSSFYDLASRDPELAWAASGAGRLLRSPTVFNFFEPDYTRPGEIM